MSTEHDLRRVRDAAQKATTVIALLAVLGLAAIVAGIVDLWGYQH